MIDDLGSLRKQIDVLDEQLIQLLADRMVLVKSVGIYKKTHNIVPLDTTRWQFVLESKMALAKEIGLDQDLVKNIYENIHQTALEIESHA